MDICALPEQRVQVKPRSSLCRHSICIEILSRDDRMPQMQDKIEDYLSFGVSYVWILDPFKRKAYRCTADGILDPRNGVRQ